MAPDRVGFAAVTGGYLATTTAEWILPPLFPLLAVELGLGTGDAGLMFAVLSGSVAVGGLVGGYALVRFGPASPTRRPAGRNCLSARFQDTKRGIACDRASPASPRCMRRAIYRATVNSDTTCSTCGAVDSAWTWD